MNDSPDISVVMGVYNGADHLCETLDSILAQEGVAFEVIVVNDGSTDQSAKILEEYASRDARIRVIEQENQGLTKSLIRGCAEARGKYIARHDVGDTSDPKKLLLQKLALDETTDLAFVSCWTEFCGPHWEFLYLVKGTGLAGSPTCIISETEKNGVIDGPTSHPSVIFRKDYYEKAGGYRAEFYFGQDWDLWYRLAESGKFRTIGQSLYKTRILPHSISASEKARQIALSALSRTALRHRQAGLSEEGVLMRARSIRPKQPRLSRPSSESAGLYFVGECLRRNGDDRAPAYFKQSIRSSPFLVKAWIRLLQHKLAGNSRKRAALQSIV